MIKTFKTKEEFNNYNEGLDSGNICYIEQDESIHFVTNNIDGDYKVYNCKIEYVEAKDDDDVITLNYNIPYEPRQVGKLWKTANLNRTFTANIWQPISLPFDVSADEIERAFGSDTLIVQFKEILKKDDVYHLYFQASKGIDIKAGHPYFIKPTLVDNQGKAIDANVTLHNVVEPANVEPHTQLVHCDSNYFGIYPTFTDDVAIYYGDFFLSNVGEWRTWSGTTPTNYLRYRTIVKNLCGIDYTKTNLHILL